MIFDNNEFASAVIFFDDLGDVSVEMNIAEFQAVLDGFVTLDDLADTTVKASYVEFDSSFNVRRAVFFMLPVGSKGEVERWWQLPLMDLASTGAKSKDLGAGPIRLVCQSQCSVEHFKSHMWDPDLTPSGSQLIKLKKCIHRNRLGVQFRDAPDKEESSPYFDRTKFERDLSARLRKEYAQEFRDHMAQLLKEQRLRIATTRTEFDDAHRSTKVHYERQLTDLQQLLERSERDLDEQRRLNRNLKETVDGQSHKIEGMRDYYERKLSHGSEDDTEALRQAIEIELSARFESESKELKEQLETREVELLYRNELEVQLHDEIARLRVEHQKAMTNTGEQLLSKLVESGISLVSYHPGAGHITVPVNEVAEYLDSPVAYAADKCGVDVDRYERWLHHYRMPVCQHFVEPDKMCGDNIERIEAPIDFKAGESDYCETCMKSKARAHLRIAGS